MMGVKRPSRKMSLRQEKICNMCGEYVLEYTVIDNAPLCKKCVPIPKKKVLNEQGMLNKLLEGERVKIK